MSFLYAIQRVVVSGREKEKSMRGAEGEKAKAFYSNFNVEGPSNNFYSTSGTTLAKKKYIFKNFFSMGH